MELFIFHKYKLPQKKKENDDESVNNSVNDLLSNFSKHSDLDAALMRQQALNRILDNLDIKNKGEELFGKKLQDALEDPRMRYSIQESKNPFNDENESEFDKRKVSTMPDMKLKEYKDFDKHKDPFAKFLNQGKFNKFNDEDSEQNAKSPKKVDKKESEKDKKPIIDSKSEESKGLTPSEQKRLDEENLQTEDKPSDEHNNDQFQDDMFKEIDAQGEQNMVVVPHPDEMDDGEGDSDIEEGQKKKAEEQEKKLELSGKLRDMVFHL